MRILFIIPNLNGDFYKPTFPPIGVASMISVLEQNGHKAEVIDMRLQKKLSDLDSKFKKFKPDMLGVSFMSRDYRKTYKFINFLKKRYKTVIIVGGAHPSLFQKEILRDCHADFSIIGESEYAILDLANKVPPKKINNLIWRNGEEIIQNPLIKIHDLDSLPFPDFTKFPLDQYIDKKIPIVTSRGCPFDCIYCSIKSVMGKKWRARSAKNIVDEIQFWKEKGYSFFHIADDNFTLNRKRVVDFCNEIFKRNLIVEWELRNGIRADTVDEELLRLMKRAGCVFVAYGIESLDQEVLRASKKNLQIGRAKQAIRDSLKVGIKTGAFFIIGLPKDNFQKFKKVLKFVQDYNLDEVEIYNCVPYPKTDLVDWINENGRFLIDPKDYLNYASYLTDKVVFETPDFSAKDRRKAFKIAEKLVWKKLLKKELGPVLGTLAYPFWMNPILKKIFAPTGQEFWARYRKRKWKKSLKSKNWEDYKDKDLKIWKEYWNKENPKKISYYRKFQTIVKKYIRNEVFAKEFAKYMNKVYPPGAVIAEAGSGSGGSCSALKQGKYKLIAVDLTLEALEFCKNFPQINYYVQADIFNMPFKNNSLDGVWNSGVMEHFYPHDNLKQLKEFHRVLKPGGQILLFWPSTKLFMSWIVDHLIELFKLDLPHLVWVPSKKDIRDLCLRAGYKTVRIDTSWTLDHYIIIAKK